MFAEGENEAQDRWDEEHGEDGRDSKAADDDGAEAAIEFGAGAGEENEGKHSANGGQG